MKRCESTALTGPNAGNRCKCTRNIRNGRCETHRKQFIDTEIEFNSSDDDVDDDEPTEYDKSFIESEDELEPRKKKKKTVPKKKRKIIIDSDDEDEANELEDVKPRKKQSVPRRKTAQEKRDLENMFATMSLHDLQSFTGIQNTHLQPVDERTFIVATYFNTVSYV